jgi:hypothetical protein
MLKAIVRTVIMVAVILLLAQQFPLIAQYQTPLLIGAVALGVLGFMLKAALLVVGILALWLLLMN